MAEKLRIVYMGTPDFAVAGLQALVEAGHKVVAVITAPDNLLLLKTFLFYNRLN